MENVDQSASHSEEVTDQSAPPQVDEKESARQTAFEAFGLVEDEEAPPTKTEKAPESVPPIEQEAERKGIKVKYNKEEVFIDEDKVPEYARKGLNYDKVEGRAKELQDALDRTARLNGFKDHSEYLANLDKIEQEREQAKEREFEELEQSLFDELVENGLDEKKAREYIDSHPLLSEARALKAERAEEQQKQQQQMSQQQTREKWDQLYLAYPELVESSTVFDRGETPDWYTPDMQTRIARGYDPLDAYELAHKTTIIDRNKQMAKQQAIKEQRLGLRAQVETDANADLEPEVPDNLASAFSLFGLGKESAKKYVRKAR